MARVTTALSLQQIIPDNQLNEWEHEELIEQLAAYDAQLERAVLEQIAVIWPVSHALCFAFLGQLHNGLHCLEPKELAAWVKGILHVYEADGLRAARLYMSDVENNFLCRLRGESGLAFAGAQGRLVPYIRGLSGRSLQLEPSASVATDTSTIFLPRDVSFYRDHTGNFQVYKLLATYQWGFISQDLYCQNQLRSASIHIPGDGQQGTEGDRDDILARFFNTFANQQLAQDIYHLLQTLRVWPAETHTTPVHRMQIWGDDGGELVFDRSNTGRDALAWIVDVPALELQLAQAIGYQPLIERLDASADAPIAPLQVVCEGKASLAREAVGARFKLASYQ
ncbi:MAG: hypothetical protein KJ717_00230, partial [Proteobacteria bacterium]|nr:hypothetical protein [Pseudomonadota bacterium]